MYIWLSIIIAGKQTVNQVLTLFFFFLSVGPKYLQHSLFILINIYGTTKMERGLVFGETDGILGVYLSTLAGIASIQSDLRGH